MSISLSRVDGTMERRSLQFFVVLLKTSDAYFASQLLVFAT
jgi:hypothetical protein